MKSEPFGAGSVLENLIWSQAERHKRRMKESVENSPLY